MIVAHTFLHRPAGLDTKNLSKRGNLLSRAYGMPAGQLRSFAYGSKIHTADDKLWDW